MAVKFPHFRALYVCLVLVNWVLFSCTKPEEVATGEATLPVLASTPTLLETYPIGPCERRAIRIAHQPVAAFQWTENGGGINYSLSSDPDEWKRIDLETGVSSDVEKPDILYFQYRSPNKKFEIKTQSPILSVDATSTPNVEGESAAGLNTENISLVDSDGHEFFLGQITGVIQNLVWSENSSRSVLVIDIRKPTNYYLYIIDVESKTLTPMFPKSPDTVVPLFKDISPDGSELIYIPLDFQSLKSQGNIRLLNLRTMKDSEISLPPSPWIWLLDSNSILSLIRDQVATYSQYNLYLLNLSSNEKSLLWEGVSPPPFMTNSIQLSPDKTKIAFVQTQDNALYTLELCLNK